MLGFVAGPPGGRNGRVAVFPALRSPVPSWPPALHISPTEPPHSELFLMSSVLCNVGNPQGNYQSYFEGLQPCFVHRTLHMHLCLCAVHFSASIMVRLVTVSIIGSTRTLTLFDNCCVICLGAHSSLLALHSIPPLHLYSLCSDFVTVFSLCLFSIIILRSRPMFVYSTL